MAGGRADPIRVSDAERDAALKVLSGHAAAGRLSMDELDERCGTALTARTRGELAAVTSDLPEAMGSSSAPARAAVRRTVAIMGGSSRRGPFRAAGSLRAIALMGSDHIDLREAEIDGDELTIRVFSVLGAVHIYVTDTVEVELGGMSVAGESKEIGVHRRRDPDGPVIRIRGFTLFGGTTVFRVPPQAHCLGLAEARLFSVKADRSPRPPPDPSAHGRRRRRSARHHPSHHRHH